MRAVRCQLDEVRDLLAPSLSPKAESTGKYTLEGLARQGQCFKVVDSTDKPVAAYILKSAGSELFVLAAAGRAQLDLSLVLNELITRQGMNYQTVAFETQRKGLVKKALEQGYEVAGYILRKKL